MSGLVGRIYRNNFKLGVTLGIYGLAILVFAKMFNDRITIALASVLLIIIVIFRKVTLFSKLSPMLLPGTSLCISVAVFYVAENTEYANNSVAAPYVLLLLVIAAMIYAIYCVVARE